jgi:hypothetical protein
METRTVYMSLIVVMLSTGIAFGQSNLRIGVNAGVGIPTGDVADFLKTGFTLGGTVLFPTSNPNVGILAGASYLRLPGKTISESFGGSTFTLEVSSSNLVSIFAGPKVGKEKGAYFLPAVSGNFDDGESRFGLDLGGGFLMPIGTGTKMFDISGKFSLTNLVGKQEGESSSNVIRILAGIIF